MSQLKDAALHRVLRFFRANKIIDMDTTGLVNQITNALVDTSVPVNVVYVRCGTCEYFRFRSGDGEYGRCRSPIPDSQPVTNRIDMLPNRGLDCPTWVRKIDPTDHHVGG